MLREQIALAITALGRNALRSVLTALGIVIGVAAVVALVTIGRGTTSKVTEEIRRLGTQLLTIRIGQDARAGSATRVDAKAFDYADVEAIKAEVPGLRAVAPLAFQPIRVVARRANWVATVTGTESDFLEARRWRLRSGRIFSGHETYAGKNVCIIGATVSDQLFGTADAIGEVIRIRAVPCEVIGVLERRGNSGLSQDDDNIVLMPLYSFQRRIQGTPDIQSILALAQAGVDTSRLKGRIEGLLRERRGLATGQPDNFSVLEMRQVAEAMVGTTRTLTALLTAIAAVSLLVGGIGIMNIMLVAVTERTREIGIRLAIGALPEQVMWQFLAEAVMLAILGGLLGIAAGLAVALVSQIWLSIPFILDPVIIAAAFLTSVVIGIAFGYLPARRAASLDPVDALRRE